jgi:hypothetical protein
MSVITELSQQHFPPPPYALHAASVSICFPWHGNFSSDVSVHLSPGAGVGTGGVGAGGGVGAAGAGVGRPGMLAPMG